MRKGFTLVELSIVLVIIGLLIGGVLVAQSMISTAKIVSVASQLQQLDAGVISFKTKFNYLPGDAPAYGGDGDGLIELTATGGSENNITENGCEIANFWNHLDPNTYISRACALTNPGLQAIISGPNRSVPASKLGKPGSFFAVSAISTDAAFADTTNPRNFYFILDPTQVQTVLLTWYRFTTTTSANSAVKPNDLLALDKKIDDGIANTGNVLSGAIGDCCGGVGAGGIVATPLATCSVGATYQIQNTGFECTPLIRIGGQTGVLQ